MKRDLPVLPRAAILKDQVGTASAPISNHATLIQLDENTPFTRGRLLSAHEWLYLKRPMTDQRRVVLYLRCLEPFPTACPAAERRRRDG